MNTGCAGLYDGVPPQLCCVLTWTRRCELSLFWLEAWPTLRPHLNESPEDGAQQLRQHVEAPAAPGCVPSQTVGQCHCRVHMPARHIGCCIDCSRQQSLWNNDSKR